jgi:rubrerythrin
MSTSENLQAAFAGESQANRKYLAFAKKAEDDGFPQIAKLFRAAADAETVHAHAHLRVMDGIKSTAENLAAAIEGEAYEYTKMYPEFLTEAEKEGNRRAVASFQNALAVEQIHHNLYQDALTTLKSGTDLPEKPIYVCQVCGNTVHELPDRCPVCNAAKAKFVEIK